MARPAGNITGFTNFESSMGGKWLQVIKELLPSIQRSAIMFNPEVSTHIAKGYYLDSLEDAAKRLMGASKKWFLLPSCANLMREILIRGGDDGSAGIFRCR